MLKAKRFMPLWALAALLAALVASCAPDYRHDEGMVWHTTYHITYRSDRQLTDSILAAIGDVDRSLNVFDPTSLASRVNESDSVPADENFRAVFDMSVRVNRLSGGAFDPTLGPLITAWGFGKGHKATADTLRIDSLLSLTGITRSRIENGFVIKGHPAMQFNFSAIAKGYGCDRVAAMLERNGVTDYLVEIGGEIRCGGSSPSGRDWRVSVDRPVVSDSVLHESQCVVSFTGMGMATSGDYRNFHGEGDGRYGHTISPVTGRPARTDVLSATVMASSAMEADALATAFMAMGSERAKKLAADLQLPVLLVLADASVWESEQMKSLVSAAE